jgi:drug/metabolite transporter (DMT)-like permease
MTLNEFLMWIANSGGGIMVVSWLFEFWPWYQAQAPDRKKSLFFLASVLLTVAGYLALTYISADVIAMIAPYFAIVYSIFGSIFLGEGFHKFTKANK